MIIGHQDLVRDFKQLAKKDRLAHGYIFFGEPEVGKFYFAKHLGYLLERGEFEMDGRPLQDALILDDATGIDAMRELKNFLWQKPNISKKRIVIINNSENLTDEAQNAILKITEEPPESALLILIVNQLDNLLPPLLSRLQKIYFGRLSDEEMSALLKVESLKLNVKDISMSFGRPGRAVRLSSDKLTAEMEECARQFIKSSGPARSKLIKELIDMNKDLAENSPIGKSDILDKFFESLILQLRKDPIWNSAVLKSVLHRLFLIKSYNTNKRLQLEAI